MNNSTMSNRNDLQDLSFYLTLAMVGKSIHLYVLPIKVVVGFLGNNLSFLVMTEKSNRILPFCTYATSLSITDFSLMLM